MPGPLAALGGAVSGFALPFEGARLLLRERRLWGLALVPLALSVVAVSVTLALVMGNAGSLYGWITGWMPQLEAAHWYAWLWIGPALLLLRLGGALLFLLLLGICLVAAYLLGSLLAAPFHDVLSRRVEQLVTGDVRDEARPGWRGALADAALSLIGEGRRIACFAAIVGPLVLVGFAVPAAHVVTGPLVLLVTLLFLPLDYASYTLDRRRYSFGDKRRWILAYSPVALGFGSAAFLTCLVPLLNFAAMPLLVVGGTLLAMRFGSASAALPAQPRAPEPEAAP
jgi:CysZ protein